MAYEESLRSISLNADSSLAVYTGVPGQPGSADPNYGQQYRFVKVTGVNQVGLITGPTQIAVGVLQNKPQVTGQAATVAIRGVSNLMAGAAVTAGALISSDANGRAITADGVDDAVYGVALTTVTGANQLVVVLLRVN
jgi:Uncharacterized conserved protein (DUF2190)